MRTRRRLILGLALLAVASAAALALTVVSRPSAQKPVAFTPVGGAPPPHSLVLVRSAPSVPLSPERSR